MVPTIIFETSKNKNKISLYYTSGSENVWLELKSRPYILSPFSSTVHKLYYAIADECVYIYICTFIVCGVCHENKIEACAQEFIHIYNMFWCEFSSPSES